MDSPAVRDAALLIVRVVVGVVFIAHGVDKILVTGIVETTGQFSAGGVPQPQISAWLATIVELIAGSMLVVGVLTSAAAGLLMLLALSAGYFVHFGHGFFVRDGGIEFVAVLAAALLIVIVFGPGRASVDGVLTRD
ncbi:DoxX family protein [Corynebacterium tapiri]|uniref:DoxX family protein n=1 Tax=Corynebacterium tapiri TaxID=1448266 RepID=A0A5C4U8D1_9CORY|nr:DoxX family protein [Corynebacterium tapiri]TNM00437.1 DoxX family protein [Corynebacterium tapiri]